MLAAIGDILSVVGIAILLIGLLVLLRRIDPHWVAKDGRAFTCRVQPIRPTGTVEGRWREARAVVDDDGLRLVQRGLGASRHRAAGAYRVVRRSDDPPPRSAVFLLDGDPMWALRVPASSKAVPVLEGLVGR